jgi:hypothetical protein
MHPFLLQNFKAIHQALLRFQESTVHGNETAVKADLKMNTCDLKSKIKKESLATWQNQWEQTTSHMLNIKRTTKRLESIKVFNSTERLKL